MEESLRERTTPNYIFFLWGAGAYPPIFLFSSQKEGGGCPHHIIFSSCGGGRTPTLLYFLLGRRGRLSPPYYIFFLLLILDLCRVIIIYVLCIIKPLMILGHNPNDCKGLSTLSKYQ